MESTTPNKFGIAIKWAIFCEIAAILLTVLFQVLNVDQSGSIRYLGLLPLVFFLVLAQNDFRKQNGGFMTYGDGFVEGLLYGVCIGVMGAIFTYIYVSYINPHMLEQALATAHQSLVDKGYTGDQLEAGDEMARKFTTPVVVAIGALFFNAIGAMILALITSAILKKERTLIDIEKQASSTDPAV